MKQVVIAFFALSLSHTAMACMSGTEFYSVVIPKSLAMDSGAQTLVVGDMLVLGTSFKVTKGEENLKEMGFNDKVGYSSGKYYLVQSEGEIELTQSYDKKETKVVYTAKTAPRARGMGCADFRRPASEPTTAPKK